MSLKKFFTAAEAAQWIGRESGESIQAADIHRLAESYALPICYRFRGSLGVFDRPCAVGNLATSVMQAAFAQAKRKAYFPAGYLRTTSGARLGAETEDLQGMVSRADHVSAGPVTIAQPARGFEGLDFDPEAEMLWPLGDKGMRTLRKSISSGDWLFHVDDLAKLVPTRASPSESSDGAGSNSSSELPLKKEVLINRHIQAWPTIEADLQNASRNGLNIAKGGNRGWIESRTLDWARSRGKVSSDMKEANPLDATMLRMARLPAKIHRLGS